MKQQNYDLENQLSQVAGQLTEEKIQILNAEIDRLAKLVE